MGAGLGASEGDCELFATGVGSEKGGLGGSGCFSAGVDEFWLPNRLWDCGGSEGFGTAVLPNADTGVAALVELDDDVENRLDEPAVLPNADCTLFFGSGARAPASEDDWFGGMYPNLNFGFGTDPSLFA